MPHPIQKTNDPRGRKAATGETIICAHLDNQSASAAESMARGAASRLVSIGEMETRNALGVLKEVVRRVGAMPGQRSIILVSPGFLVPMGVRLEESDLMDRALRSNVIVSALDARGLYVVIPGGDASQPGYNSAVMNEKSMYY